MRIYDPRIGKFLSVDPLTNKYAYYTPYAFAGNKPIWAVDLDGEEEAAAPYIAHTSNSMFEGNLRRTDPEHAEQIIYEQNKQAFLTVGGMLTAGSGSLFSLFTDGVTVYGAYKVGKGIAKKDANEVREGIRLVSGSALGDIGGIAIGRILGELGYIGNSVGKDLSEVYKNSKGFITGDEGVILNKYRQAMGGNLAASAEIRVAKLLRSESKNVHFINSDIGNATDGSTNDFLVDGGQVEVKRLSGIGSNAAKQVKKAANQVGPGGEVIVVRPADSKSSLDAYNDFFKNFKTPQNAKIRVVNESDLPKLNEKNGQ